MAEQDVYNSKDLKLIASGNLDEFKAPIDLLSTGLQGDPVVTLSFPDDQSGYEEDHTGETGVWWVANSKKGGIALNNVMHGSDAHKFLNRFYEAQKTTSSLLMTVYFESGIDEETHIIVGKVKKKPDLAKGVKVTNSEWMIEGRITSVPGSLDSISG